MTEATSTPGLTSRRPYLLRAMHEWITDNNQTPHIVVDASLEAVEVPRQYVQAGKIVLNVSLSATSGLALGNEFVCFQARFGGATYRVNVPIAAVLGIYARETGQGMIFSEADISPTPPAPPTSPTSPDRAPSSVQPLKPKGGGDRPKLKVVK